MSPKIMCLLAQSIPVPAFPKKKNDAGSIMDVKSFTPESALADFLQLFYRHANIVINLIQRVHVVET